MQTLEKAALDGPLAQCTRMDLEGHQDVALRFGSAFDGPKGAGSARLLCAQQGAANV